MQAVIGQPLTVTLQAPPGITELGARLEAPGTRAVVSRYRRATLAGGLWIVTLDGPTTSGLVLLVWRTPDPEPPMFETFVAVTAGVRQTEE